MLRLFSCLLAVFHILPALLAVFHLQQACLLRYLQEMQSRLGRFRVNPLSQDSVQYSGPLSTPPVEIEFRIQDEPQPTEDPKLKPVVGSFEYDLASSKYQHRWDDWTKFQEWLSQEQQQQCIELHLVNTYRRMPAYERKCRYVCSRAGTGGVKAYRRRQPEWKHKLEAKRTGCECCLLVKEYPGTSTVLGNYFNVHNHPTGNENLRYMQIPKETKEYIAGLLRLKVSPEHIVSDHVKLYPLY